MKHCWILKQLNQGEQSSHSSPQDLFHSYIGGYPTLPPACAIPHCKLCQKPQTFFLQAAFPTGHPWAGYSLAVFSCTSCVHQEHVIPEMLRVPLYEANIPAGFLEAYQVNFRFVVYRSNEGNIRSDYEQRIRYIPLVPKLSEDPCMAGTKIGGKPKWLLGDEHPATLGGSSRMIFLMQIERELRFPLVPTAPRQVVLDLQFNPKQSPKDYYRLFLGNEIYLFGTEDPVQGGVYAITQC